MFLAITFKGLQMNDDDFLALRKFVVSEFIFGTKARKLSGQYAQNLGLTNILLVTDGGVEQAGWTDDLIESLREISIRYTVYDKVTSNPKDYEVMGGAELFKTACCDGIIAIGGGSVIDCAKGIGIIASNEGHISDYEGVDNIPVPSVPIVCVPTTAGTSADISQFAIITNTRKQTKFAIISKSVIPDVALIDPEVTLTMDKKLTAYVGVDAFVHAVEALVSNAGSPITELHALEAARIIYDNIYNAVNELGNLELRKNMMLASLHAGLAFSNASLGLIHAMAHSLGGLKDSAHGICNAILLPYVIDYNFESAKQQYLKMARIMGIQTDNLPAETVKNELLNKINFMLQSIGIVECLSDLGIKKVDLSALASRAMKDPCLLSNPAKTTHQDIEAIYEKAL